MDPGDPPAVTDLNHSAGPAAGQYLVGLDRHHDPTGGVVGELAGRVRDRA